VGFWMGYAWPLGLNGTKGQSAATSPAPAKGPVRTLLLKVKAKGKNYQKTCGGAANPRIGFGMSTKAP